ncbi:MAG: DUF4312 family protein [Anaerorhabdus sp.]
MEVNKELIVSEVIENIIETSGKSELELMQSVFKKHRQEMYSSIDGYVVEMHITSFVIEELTRDAIIKKFLFFFLPQEHEFYTIKVKLVTELKIIRK